MNVTELKEYLNKIYDPDETIVVTIKHNEKGKNELVEVDSTDFIYGEYKDYKTESIKTDDLVVIY